MSFLFYLNNFHSQKVKPRKGAGKAYPSRLPEREKKTKDKLENHEDSADPKTHIRFFFHHSPFYSQVAESGV
jgi:hypothetical protein